MSSLTRDQLLALSDQDLFEHCRMDCFRASGPGGQHRNRTDTAVRLVLRDYPEVSAEANETRSQHANRVVAMQRLRFAIATHLRESKPPAWPGPWQLNPKNPEYPKLVGVVLDALDQHGFRVSAAAEVLGLSTAKLNKVLERDPALWRQVHEAREARGLKPLRPHR